MRGNCVIVRTLDEVKSSGGYGEKVGVWSSARYLLRSDDVGFTLTRTSLAAGQCLTLEYKNHIEANLVIQGDIELTDLATDQSYRLGPGAMYALDKHDRHRVQALTEVELVCVFTPALKGDETHDKDGSYPA